MSTVTLNNYDSTEVEELQQFEKIRRSEKAPMPSHRTRSAVSASHRTPASKSNSRKISRTCGGKHRRSNRKY